MRRLPFAPGRTLYKVRRPSIVIDCCAAVLSAIAGAGVITLIFQYVGMVQS